MGGFMDKIKKHRSHITGKIGCRPFGKYKEILKKKEEVAWLKQQEEIIIHEDQRGFSNHIRIVEKLKKSK
jgi:hypothetical protein